MPHEIGVHMPFSQSSQISAIVAFLEQTSPRSVLDVGVGMGQYGYLARMHLENVDLFEIHGAEGRLKRPDEWARRIDGIEGCSIYLTPVHEYVYNKIFIGDALEILPTLADDAYEVVLAVDILEHFTTGDGRLFLHHLQRVASQHVLVSTPKEFVPQQVEPNPYENHRSLWSDRDLIELGYRRILPNDQSWIAVLSHV